MTSDDSLANVSGRAWLIAELDRIGGDLCSQLVADYSEVRGKRIADRKKFIDSVEDLRVEAFATARAIASGSSEIRSVISVLNWLARLDAAAHSKDMDLGRGKAAKDSLTGFGSLAGDHEIWGDAFLQALADEQAHGNKRPKTAAAKRVIEDLQLAVTPGQVLRVVREQTLREK